MKRTVHASRWLCVALVAVACSPAAGAQPATLEIRPAVVTLIDEVAAPAHVAGALKELAVRPGDQVKQGQLVARIDDTQARLAMDQAELELKIAEQEARNELKVQSSLKAAAVARAEWKRATESIEKYDKSISQTELDRLRLAAEQAELQADQARHEVEVARLTAELKQNALDQARYEVDRRAVLAPINGTIVEVADNVGEWVQPGTTIMRIVRLDRLRVECFAAAAAVEDIEPGTPVVLRMNAAGDSTKTFAGVVTFISPEIDPVSGQVRVWAEVDNPQLKLRPGVTATLVISPATASAKD